MTYSFYRAINFGKWNVNSGMGKQDHFFYMHLFLGGGEGNPIIRQHDTRVKKERSARTSTKMLLTSKQLTEVSTRLKAVGPLNVKISTNVIKSLKC